MKKTRDNNNNMLMHGFILMTILATAKSAEAEITMEAAFQGRCGHTSPCEQLCYEIHDGMYECDCIEGYELNKNGYSCQVINSTSSGDGHSKSDEDVLYQKGASFSAKLANDNENQLFGLSSSSSSSASSSSSSSAAASTRSGSSSSSSGSEEGMEEEDVDDSDMFFNDDLERMSSTKENVNSKDYYISSESISFSNNQADFNANDNNNNNNFNDVPEFGASLAVNLQKQQQSQKQIKQQKEQKKEQQEKQQQKKLHRVMLTTSKPHQVVINGDFVGHTKRRPRPFSPQTTGSTSTTIPTTITTTTIHTAGSSSGSGSESVSSSSGLSEDGPAMAGGNIEDDYYFKQDMSIYDDVNNNQLNLRPLSPLTYQSQNAYRFDSKTTNSMAKTNSNLDLKPMSILYNGNNDNDQKQNQYGDIETTTTIDQVGGEKETAIKSSSSSENISKKNGSVNGVSSEPCDLECGGDGSCDISAEGRSRCLCPFGKTGSGCLEDVKVRTPKFSKKSWLAFPALRGAYKHVQIRVEFRPESFDGIILLSGERDDLTGDFMALLLKKGFVEFWFDCGSGVGSVRSKETILLNEWNSVIIYRHRWDAWLVLNHGTRVQGRSNGLFSRITFREPVFLGGTGNITGLAKRLPVHDGFEGCIRRFVANEHEYKFEEHPLGDVSKGFDIQDCVTDKCFKYPCQHGGKCLPSDQGAVCLCPIGFVGDLCEIRMDLQVPAFNGSSFLRYAPLGDSALIWLELKVILKPEHSDGIILYSGPERRGDFIALSLNGGYVEFSFDLGSGPAVVRSDHPLSIGQWHTIKVSRTARLAVLKVDNSPEVMTISSNGFWHLSLPHNLFLGGVNHMDNLPAELKYRPYFVGCIQKIDINGHALAIVSEALGGTNIGNCPHACVARPCGPLAQCIPQMESYECRCSAFNAQCNKAAEVPLEELQIKRARNRNNKSNNSNISNNKLSKSNKSTKSTESIDPNKSTESIKSIKFPPKHVEHHEQKLKKSHSYKMKSKKFAQKTKHVHKTTEPPTSTTMTKDLAGEVFVDDDDIIFRDVHAMHRSRKGHKDQETQTIHHVESATQRNPKQLKHTSKHLGKEPHTKHHSHLDLHPASAKHDPHHKHPVVERKLSKLPTHYESFQTNPDSDILTFDRVEDVTAPDDDDSLEDEDYLYPDYGEVIDREAIDAKAIDGEVIDGLDDKEAVDVEMQMEQAKVEDQGRHRDDFAVEPFAAIDDTLFDDGDDADESHKKQFAQDMKRIMGNTHEHTMKEKPEKRIDEGSERKETNDQKVFQDSEEKESHEGEAAYDRDDNNDVKTNSDDVKTESDDVATDDDDDHDVKTDSDDTDVDDTDSDDDLLEPVAAIDPKPNDDAHTDWSVLKRFDLTGVDHPIGVKKNFGACFAGTDSYFHYNDAETMSQIISYTIDLNLRIKTHSQNGVILWTGRQGTTDEDDDFLSLGIENGYLHFRYDLGSGEIDIRFNTSKVSDGLWHRVRAIRDSQEGFLEVDGRKTQAQRSPGRLRQLNTDTGLYVGGMPDVSYFTRRKYNGGIVGCISEIVLAGELKLNFDPNTLGTAHNVETGIL